MSNGNLLRTIRFRPRLLITLAVTTALALPAVTATGSQAAVDTSGRPVFQLPFRCGTKAYMGTGGSHFPAEDIFRNPQSETAGEPVVASAAGTVNQSYNDAQGGNVIQINHGNGWFTTQIHLTDRLIKKGDPVTKGQLIGHAGQTGSEANGIDHVHYEQAYDVNGDGSAPWGAPNNERQTVVFDGVAYPQASWQEVYLTSANCAASGPSLGIGVFRPSAHTWFAPGQVIRQNWGDPGDQPLVGDWNGDGEPGLAVFRPSTKTWYTPGDTWMTNWGDPGDLALGGDFNGDGKDEPAVFRPSTKTWYVPGRVLRSNWGEQGDLPIAGDFNGDGTDEIGVYRPSTQTWYTPGRTLATDWGLATDKPVVGDFDGNGTDEIGVFRASNKSWYTPGRIMRRDWGEADDLPVAGL